VVSGVTDILGVPVVVIMPPWYWTTAVEFTMLGSRKSVKHADTTIKPSFNASSQRSKRYISNWFVAGDTTARKSFSTLRPGNCVHIEAWLL
jgi:hypothetical protein